MELLQQQPFGSLVFTLKGSTEQRLAAKRYFEEKQLKFNVLGPINEGGLK